MHGETVSSKRETYTESGQIKQFNGAAYTFTLQVPREFGSFSPSIFEHFILPMHEDNKALMAALVRLVEACEPVLRKGSSCTRCKVVANVLLEVEACRWELIPL